MSASTPLPIEQPTFHKQRHIKYFLRCLKTFLPGGYTSNDSARMTLAFFIVAGLDLLDVLDTSVTDAERAGYINWIYHCQVDSTGGFRGFPGTDFGPERRTAENQCWDPANVPATFFALTTLLVLGDDLARVKRSECLRWLRRMQRADGSFGEVEGPNGKIEGDRDLRFCCCAAGVRYVLRGKNSKATDAEDIDVQRLVSYVQHCQSYDGGFAGAPGNEPHAGLTYCALGTLSFLGLLPETVVSPARSSEMSSNLLGWLASRQTTEIDEEDDQESETHVSQLSLSDQSEDDPETTPGPQTTDPEAAIASLPVLPDLSDETPGPAGFNGRLNKTADTCYCFWMLDQLKVVNAEANRKFLLNKTQHLIGGFGKGVGIPPDVLHSYLGLASLGLFGESGVDEVDATFCTSKRTRKHLESLPWWTGAD